MRDKKIRILFGLLVLCSLLNPMYALANGPKPASNITLYIEDRKEGAAYVDILIKLDENHPHYTEANEDIIKQYEWDLERPIVSYNKNGYISYSIHYKGASSQMELKEGQSYYQFAYENPTDFDYIFGKSRKIQIALLDYEGNILQISSPCTLNSTINSYLYGSVNYDAYSNKVIDVDRRENPFLVLIPFIYIMVWIIPLSITLISEGLIAKLMKFDKISIMIILNIVSNFFLYLFMSYLQMLYVPYVTTLIIGEILVYGFEFVILRFGMYKTMQRKRILLYVVLANSISLVLTLIVNQYIQNIYYWGRIIP